MNLPKWLIPLVVPVITMAIGDLQGFTTARKADPNVKFDWSLFGMRLLVGAMTGFLAALGQTYATPQ